jgi:hypothetical protein
MASPAWRANGALPFIAAFAAVAAPPRAPQINATITLCGLKVNLFVVRILGRFYLPGLPNIYLDFS